MVAEHVSMKPCRDNNGLKVGEYDQISERVRTYNVLGNPWQRPGHILDFSKGEIFYPAQIYI